MDDKLRDQLLKLKVKAWAFALANEFGAVPKADAKNIKKACEVFGEDYGIIFLSAMTQYEGYSDSDLSSGIIRELRNLEF